MSDTATATRQRGMSPQLAEELGLIEQAKKAIWTVEAHVKAALPVTATTQARVIIQAAMRQIEADTTGRLAKCSIDSLRAAVLEAASYGLVPGVARHGSLQAFFSKKKDCLEAKWITEYGGLLELLRREPDFLDCKANVVYDGDEFEYVEGTEPLLRHVPQIPRPQNARLRCAYFLVRRRDRPYPNVTVLTADEIERVHQMAVAKNNGKDTPAWCGSYGEMAKKTVIRNGCKTQPCSIELARMLEMQQASEGWEFEVENPAPVSMPRRASDKNRGHDKAAPDTHKATNASGTESPAPSSETNSGEEQSRPQAAQRAKSEESPAPRESDVPPNDVVSPPSDSERAAGTLMAGGSEQAIPGLQKTDFDSGDYNNLIRPWAAQFGDPVEYLTRYEGTAHHALDEAREWLDSRKKPQFGNPPRKGK